MRGFHPAHNVVLDSDLDLCMEQITAVTINSLPDRLSKLYCRRNGENPVFQYLFKRLGVQCATG